MTGKIRVLFAVVVCGLVCGHNPSSEAGRVTDGPIPGVFPPSITVEEELYFGTVLTIDLAGTTAPMNIYFGELFGMSLVVIEKHVPGGDPVLVAVEAFTAEESAEIDVVLVHGGSGDDNIDFSHVTRDDYGRLVFTNLLFAIGYGGAGEDFCYGSHSGTTTYFYGEADDDGWDSLVTHGNED